MPLLTIDQLKQICTTKVSARQVTNMQSFLLAVNQFGPQFGMDKPYNLASFIGQIMEESGEFNYDREIWGPTSAQKKYDTRVDLGNTPEKDGDGSKFRGYGPLQLTGRHNVTEFYHWCLQNHVSYGLPVPPDFIANPSRIVTDPWEGLSALWYWGFGNPEHVSLNKYSSQNNQLMVTKRINGGTTHYDRRLNYQARAAMVLLGYSPTTAGIKMFQRTHPMSGTPDGIVGDKTRAALHDAMEGENPLVKKISVPVPIDRPTVPDEIDHKVKKMTNRWSWFTGLFGGAGLSLGWVSGVEWEAIIAIGGILLVFIVIIVLMRHQIIDFIKEMREAVEAQ